MRAWRAHLVYADDAVTPILLNARFWTKRGAKSMGSDVLRQLQLRDAAIGGRRMADDFRNAELVVFKVEP